MRNTLLRGDNMKRKGLLLKPETVEEIRKRKEHPRETWDDVLNRMIKLYDTALEMSKEK